jgi:hypothetical protein
MCWALMAVRDLGGQGRAAGDAFSEYILYEIFAEHVLRFHRRYLAHAAVTIL